VNDQVYSEFNLGQEGLLFTILTPYAVLGCEKMDLFVPVACDSEVLPQLLAFSEVRKPGTNRSPIGWLKFWKKFFSIDLKWGDWRKQAVYCMRAIENNYPLQQWDLVIVGARRAVPSC